MDYGVKYDILVNGGAASDNLTKFLNTSNKVIPKVNKKFEQMNTKIDKTIKKIEALKRGLRGIDKIKVDIRAKNTIKDIDEIARKLKSIKSKSVNVTINQKGAVGRSSSMGKFGRSGSPSAMGRAFSPTSMMSAGGIPFATTIGAGLIGLGLRSIISESTQFQHTMVTVRSILRTTDKDAVTFNERFEQMSLNMRKLGVDTKFTATEIADATKFLSMAGMNLKTIDSSMKTITNMAAIGDFDLGQMADIVTNIMTGYGIGADQINKAGDVMSAVTSRANVNIMEMGESMKYASNYMRMAGVQFTEGSAAVGILGNAGMKGSLAGTALRAMIIRLIAPTNKAQKVIDRLGVSFTTMTEQNGKMKEVVKPLHTIFSELKGAGASMEDLKTIFDKVGGGAAMALVNNLGKLKELTQSASVAGGTSDFLAEEKMKTVVGLSQQITSKFQDLGQTLFNKLSPKISQMMEDLLGWMKTDEADDLFKGITRGISSLLDGLKKIAVFTKNNWGWLKFVLGGVALKGVASRGIGMGASLLGGARSMVGGLGRVGQFVTGGRLAMAGSGTASRLWGIATAGHAAKAASLSVGALAGSLGAVVAGGAVAAGIGAIAWQIWKAHENTKSFLRTKDEISDWSLRSTGMNTESLDLLQTKLDNLRNTGNEINLNKRKMTAPERMWGDAIEAYNKMSGSRGFYKSSSIQSIESGILDAARNMAIGSQEAKSVNEKFLSIFRATDPTKQNAILGGLMRDSRSFQLRSSGRSLADIMSSDQYFSTSPTQRNRDLKNSLEYNDELNRLTQARIQQAREVMGLMRSGTSTGGIQALDALLGTDVDLKGVWTTAQRRGTQSPEDMRALLRASGTSVTEIMTSLQAKGFQTSMINSLMQLSGFSKLVDTTIKTSTDIDNITTDDDLYGGGLSGGLSGTGGVGGRSGKMLIVQIGNLMNVEEANFKDKEDLDAFKAKMAEALVDVVRDFEMSQQ